MTIGGAVAPSDRPLGDWLEQRREAMLDDEVVLDASGELVTLTLGQLGVELDVADTLQRAREHIKAGGLRERLARAYRAWRGEEDVPLSTSFDRDRARRTLSLLAPSVRQEPVDAHLDLHNRRRVLERPGRQLDVEGTVDVIAGGEHAEYAWFTAAVDRIPPKVTSSMLEAVDVSRLLASYETSFENKAGARAVNIARAAHYLNGTVLAPGEVFSFNKVVGERTLERGFVEAPVIVEDEMEKDVGGGVCQVATTLHAAAVHGLLEIVRRRSHSRPSGYAPLGLDATVIDREVDLRIKNPFDVPLMVHAYLPSRYVIRVELLGLDPPAKVEHRYAVIETQEFHRRIYTKPELAPNTIKQKQKGILGYDIVSVLDISYPDGRTDRRRYKSKYWPVPEVFWVGPGVDLSELPPLPEQATHVVVDRKAQPQDPAGIAGPAPYLDGDLRPSG